MSDWDNLADGTVSTGFRPPSEITVLFDDRTLTFRMPAAATLTDLARRLAEEGGPRGQMLSVTIKLGGGIGVGHRSRQRATPGQCASQQRSTAVDPASLVCSQKRLQRL